MLAGPALPHLGKAFGGPWSRGGSVQMVKAAGSLKKPAPRWPLSPPSPPGGMRWASTACVLRAESGTIVEAVLFERRWDRRRGGPHARQPPGTWAPAPRPRWGGEGRGGVLASREAGRLQRTAGGRWHPAPSLRRGRGAGECFQPGDMELEFGVLVRLGVGLALGGGRCPGGPPAAGPGGIFRSHFPVGPAAQKAVAQFLRRVENAESQ